MRLTDAVPIEKWGELEKSVHDQSGLSVSVFDPDGFRITEYTHWANRLCPAIKATQKGQTYICSVAHRHIAAQAVNSGAAVVDECDAGLIKIVVPVFVGDECIGVVGGCGLLPTTGEVESFLIHSVTGIAPEEIETLARGIGTLSQGEAESACRLIQRKLDELFSGFENTQDEDFAD